MTKRTDPTTIRFLAYYTDQDNWSGMPLVGGNVGGDAADKGFLVNMKKRGWITTEDIDEDGCIWMDFTDKGRAQGALHGYDADGHKVEAPAPVVHTGRFRFLDAAGNVIADDGE